jgi:hypothetical protein
MVIDARPQGLAQSRFHPLAHQMDGRNPDHDEPASTPQKTLTDPDEQEAFQAISQLVSPHTRDAVWQAVQRLVDAKVARSRPASEASTGLEERIATAVAQRLQRSLDRVSTLTEPDPTRARSYAEAARTPPSLYLSLPSSHSSTKPTRPRADRETTFATRDATDDIKARNSSQIVQAVNAARGGTDVVAARKLPSGDTVIVFKTARAAQSLDDTWITKAFGEGVSASRPGFAVIAKGVRAASIPNDTNKLLDDINRQNDLTIRRVKPRRRRNDTAERTQLILTLSTPEEANLLCERGLILDCEVFNCEPFEESLRPQQCFQCYRFGHIARFCTAKPTCGRCGGAAHADDQPCPANNGTTPASCVLCNGAHPAWDRTCPEVRKRTSRAREAYLTRPKQFATPPPNRTASEPGFRFGSALEPASHRGPGRLLGSKTKRPRTEELQNTRAGSEAPPTRIQTRLFPTVLSTQ